MAVAVAVAVVVVVPIATVSRVRKAKPRRHAIEVTASGIRAPRLCRNRMSRPPFPMRSRSLKKSCGKL